MSDVSKAVKQTLEQLAETAYRRDLDNELEKLQVKFQEWKEGGLDGFNLNQIIHEHHDGRSRELWKFYNQKPDVTVPAAIARGTLNESEVPAEVLALIRDKVETFRKTAKQA